mmetsp:Transcript_39104/g.59645  ORF Transcript_39104/g.59645 Transcript_39104/m.59645 type:complete len:192 (-) Transcript_39104:43-618(-)
MLSEQIKHYENLQRQSERMMQLHIFPGVHYEVEACDDGYDQPPHILASMLPGEDPESKWCVDFTPYDFGAPIGKESSSDGAGAGCFVRFKFTRPFMFRGYAFVIGNDYPERDPMYWKVIVKDSNSHITTMQEEGYHAEKHDGSIMGEEPERLSQHRFLMRKMLFTDEVIFRFGMTRGEAEHLQVGKILFFT